MTSRWARCGAWCSLLMAMLVLVRCAGGGVQTGGVQAGVQAGGAVSAAAPTAVAKRPVQTAAEASLAREDRAADSVIVTQKIEWARAQHYDTLSTGALMVALGRTFVGTPYVPQVLETAGPEHVVVNLRALDCVTFVENMLALARTIRSGGDFPQFVEELRYIRYHDGEVKGYASRLHYFSEWIGNNAAKGVLEDVTPLLGGVQDSEPLSFMTQHRGDYRQLADDAVFAAIKDVEWRAASTARFFIPKQNIAAIAAQIRDGDIIGATSTLPGMDVAHTGIAVWQNGALHFMHAPLVGDSVEISAQPLAVRIQGMRTQDGIMVARPRSN